MIELDIHDSRPRESVVKKVFTENSERLEIYFRCSKFNANNTWWNCNEPISILQKHDAAVVV